MLYYKFWNSIYIVRRSRRARPVVAVVVLRPVRPSRRPSRSRRPPSVRRRPLSVRPSVRPVVGPVVVVRPLFIRPRPSYRRRPSNVFRSMRGISVSCDKLIDPSENVVPILWMYGFCFLFEAVEFNLCLIVSDVRGPKIPKYPIFSKK